MSAPEPPTRVALADGDPLARRVVRVALEREPDLEVVGEAGDGEHAVALVAGTSPHVLLAELTLPLLDGIGVVRRLRDAGSDTQVVILSMTRSRQLEMRAVLAGASGYLRKSDDLDAVVRAVRGVARGEAAVSRLLATALVERLRQTPEAGIGVRPVRSPLTGREWEILDLMTLGAGTRDIAAQLFLSEHTVHSHAKSIRRKLGVRTRAEAVEAGRRLRRAL